MGKARIILLAIEDITTRKEMEQEIKRLAYHDPLTNLPKRMLFTDRLNMAKILSDRDRKKVALMMLDLDKFKAINDALGHHIGDLLLQVAAE
jgi:diguanylate cyclase (GGDEF)-like protein